MFILPRTVRPTIVTCLTGYPGQYAKGIVAFSHSIENVTCAVMFMCGPTIKNIA